LFFAGLLEENGAERVGKQETNRKKECPLDRTAKQLVDFTAKLRYEDLPKSAISNAKARLINCLGVSLGALNAPPVKIARKLAYPIASGPAARTFGTLTPTSPDLAAFVNSAMTRFLDMSDTRIREAVSHPADALPGLIAIAESENLSGKDLLLAQIISYEVQCRFVDVVPINHLGWDQTSVVAMGTALGAGRLLGLNKKQLLNALSLAVIPTVSLNQTRTGKVSMWKGMAGPAGARQGVFAALLAREGMTGPDHPFEGDYGVWKQMFEKSYRLPIPTKFKGHTFAIEQTVIKSFPVRFNCHVPIFAALELRKKLKPADIKHLKIESIRQAFDRWVDLPEIWKPETRETADHSLPFCVSVALIDGKVTPATFTSERFKDKDVLALMQKCSIELPDEYAELAFETRCCQLTATTKAGKTVSLEFRLTPKDDERPMPKKALETKFNNLTEQFLKPAARKQLLDLCWRVDKLKSIVDIVSLTGVDGADVNGN
jgi:2-methylcitrate dehydratase